MSANIVKQSSDKLCGKMVNEAHWMNDAAYICRSCTPSFSSLLIQMDIDGIWCTYVAQWMCIRKFS